MQQRKLLLPPFHGARMQSYRDLMREVAAAEIETWPRGESYRLRPRMQALTLEVILRTVFGLGEGERIERLRCELRGLLSMLTRPQTFVLPALMGPDRLARLGPFQALMRRVDRLIYDMVQRWDVTPARPEAEPVLRRAITETPRHDAEVVLA